MTAQDCPQCGYQRATTTADAVALVAGAPARYRACFADRSPADAARVPASGVWSPVAYLWHVVDVLRYGAEKLWLIALDPASVVVPWDADEMAAARGYSGLSLPVGLHALDRAREGWLAAYDATPAGAAAHHPEIGRMTAAVMADRNAHEVVHHAFDIERGLDDRVLSPGDPA